MGLQIGIIGLPNVGKSTIFNALTGTQNAEVANYPFCTIQPNRAIVPIPDPRVKILKTILEVPNAYHATLEFVDIAGLVKGASRGEGLGNQFLGNIREVDAIVHVVRCFEDANVSHIGETIDPPSDIAVIELELILADLQQLEKRLEKLSRQVKGDRKLEPLLEMAAALQDHLQAGLPASEFQSGDRQLFQSFNQEMRFLSAKPVIFAANTDEGGLVIPNKFVSSAEAEAQKRSSQLIVLSAALEAGLIGLQEAEILEYLQLAGVAETGLDQVIKMGAQLLGLISYFTKNENEVRAWNIREGMRAPEAAGIIHTDFKSGFIRAEVVPFDRYEALGSDNAARAAGAMRIEGKEYIVQDGDVIFFRIRS